MEKIILKYALQNAIKYDGKANPGSVIGKVLSEIQITDKQSLIKKVNEIISRVNKLTKDQQINKLYEIDPSLLEKKKEEEHELHDLPNIKDKVILRLAPYPSGPLHIGNARPYILNDEYAKKYKGKLLLIIDDTIGSEEKDISVDAYKLIPEGLQWLDINFDKNIIYKSDRLEIYYKYALDIIKKDLAYICQCSPETLRENRVKGIACNCRSHSIEDNLELWQKMFKAKEGKYVLRIKTDMSHPNPAFRDRVLFRISNREHPKTHKKYRVWPLLEFSWAIDDHLLNVTHVIRGKELMMESEMEKYIWDIFGWEHPNLIHTGLLQLEGIKLSKSKSKKEVTSGKYFGWDDPRTWSLQSLKRRGILPEAIRKFCLSFGLNQNEITVPIENLYHENKKLIEKSSNRYFFIENPKKITIKNAPKMIAKVPIHPDFKKRGSRIFKTKNQFYIMDKLEKNKMYRFMHLFNFKNNEFISKSMDKELNAKLIHWLPVSKDLIKTEIIMPNGSIAKGLSEKDTKKIKVNNIIQFERLGFCRLDKKEKNKLIFWYTHN
jgi:glutamyl-tRNA synthetase